MPIKRRVGKARKQLDSEELQDLFYGPDTSLINGTGYLGVMMNDRRWGQLSEAERGEVLAAMRADWERFRMTVLAAWDARDANELFFAERHQGAPDRPWAEIHFDAPARNEPGQAPLE